MASSCFQKYVGIGELTVLLCKTKQRSWVCMEICLSVGSVGGTKSLITAKDGFGVGQSGILIVLRIEKHVIIEVYYLVCVTGLLAPEKIKLCFQEIAQEYS